MIARRSAREMHWVLQVIGFCPECAKGISEWISGIATRLPIDVATRRRMRRAAQPSRPSHPASGYLRAIFFALRAFRRLLRTNPSPCRTTSASRLQPDETFPAVRAGDRFPQIWATVAPGCYVL